MRWLAYIGIAVFLLFFALGYSYFYPASSPLASQTWFTESVVPHLDSWLVVGRRGELSGHLLGAKGDLKYKSDSDFVFYPARGGQRFYGKTMIASGSASVADIEVAEGVRVQLEANSLLMIEPPVPGQEEGPSIHVIGGAAIATASAKASPTAKKVRVVSSTGKSRVVDQKGVAVVADGKGYIGEVPSVGISELRSKYATQSQQVIEQERLLRAEAARVAAAKQQEALLKAQQEAAKQIQKMSISEEVRAPASLQSSEQAVSINVPQKIVRRKFNESLVTSQKVAPNTSVARGLYQAKRGERGAATRSFASALSSPLYAANEAFSSSVQLALDGIVESYVMSGKCQLAKDTVANALRQYPRDRAAQTWGSRWQARIGNSKTNCR